MFLQCLGSHQSSLLALGCWGRPIEEPAVPLKRAGASQWLSETGGGNFSFFPFVFGFVFFFAAGGRMEPWHPLAAAGQ